MQQVVIDAVTLRKKVVYEMLPNIYNKNLHISDNNISHKMTTRQAYTVTVQLQFVVNLLLQAITIKRT